MSQRVLVTGAQGYVGRYTVAELLRRGVEVLGTGRSSRQDDCFTHSFDYAGSAYPSPLPVSLRDGIAQGYSYEACDLTDGAAIAALIQAFRPHRVIHLAGVLRDESEQALTRSNKLATANLAAAMARFIPESLLVLGSSGSVYGNQQQLPIAETAEPAPLGDYAISKRASELAAMAVAQAAGLPLIIARIFNLIGPGIQTRHLPGYLAHKIAEIEAGACEPLIELGSLEATRDLIDVRDVAVWLATVQLRQAQQSYNIAAGVEVRMSDLVASFAERSTVQFQLKINEARNRVGSDRLVARTSIHELVPTLISLQQSIGDMLDYGRSCRPKQTWC